MALFLIIYALYLDYLNASVYLPSLQWQVPSQPVTGGYNYPKIFKYESIQPNDDGWVLSFSATALSDIVISLSTQVGGPPQSGANAKTTEIWLGALAGSFSMIRSCSGPNGLWSCRNLITWDSTAKGASYFSGVRANNYWIYYTRGRLAVGNTYMPTYIVSRYLQNSSAYAMPDAKEGLWMQLVDISLNGQIRDIGFGGYASLVDFSNIHLFDHLNEIVPSSEYVYSGSSGKVESTPFTCINNHQIRLSVTGEIECKSGDAVNCLPCNSPEPIILQPAKPCANISPLVRGRYVRISYINPATQNFIHMRELEVYDAFGSVISRGKPVSASSIFHSLAGSNLVDGDLSTMVHTNNNPRPVFVRLDLQEDVEIYGLRIWNRIDLSHRLHNTIVAIENSTMSVVFSTKILSTTPHTNKIYSFGTTCFLAKMGYYLWDATAFPVHARHSIIPSIKPIQDPKKFLLHFTVNTDGEFSIILSENGASTSISQSYYEVRVNQIIGDKQVSRILSCRSNSISACMIISSTTTSLSLNATQPREFWLWYNNGAIAIGSGRVPQAMAFSQLLTFTRLNSRLTLPTSLVFLAGADDATPLDSIQGIGYGGWLNDVTISEVSIMPMLEEVVPSNFFSCIAPTAAPSQTFIMTGSNYFGLQSEPYTTNTGITFSLTEVDSLENIFGFYANDYLPSKDYLQFEVRNGQNWVKQQAFNMDQIGKGFVRLLPGQRATLDGRTRKVGDKDAWSVMVSFSNGLFRSQSMMCPPLLMNNTLPPFSFSNATPVATTTVSQIQTSTRLSRIPRNTKNVEDVEELFLFIPVPYAYYVYGGAGGVVLCLAVCATMIFRRRKQRRKKNGDFMLAEDVKPSDFNETNLTNALDNVLNAPKQTSISATPIAGFSPMNLHVPSSALVQPSQFTYQSVEQVMITPPISLQQTQSANMGPGSLSNGMFNTLNPMLPQGSSPAFYTTSPRMYQNSPPNTNGGYRAF